MPKPRILWIDAAKGLCIALIVTMHATLGVEEALGREGYLHALVTFAQPVRIPAFFALSGLLLSRVIERDWRSYLDTKLVHFAYFYCLWFAIQAVVKFPYLASGEVTLRELSGLFQPAGTLWFIAILPVFFVCAKLLQAWPRGLVWMAAAALHFAPVDTDFVILDEFAARYVFFLTGYWLAPTILALASAAVARPLLATMALAFWAVGNAWAIDAGVADMRGPSLVLGLAGAAAVAASAALVMRRLPSLGALLQVIGERSLVIFLAFFLPMALTRMVLLRFAPDLDAGTISLLATVAGIVGPLGLHAAVRQTRLRFLFARPAWMKLPPRRGRGAPVSSAGPADGPPRPPALANLVVRNDVDLDRQRL